MYIGGENKTAYILHTLENTQHTYYIHWTHSIHITYIGEKNEGIANSGAVDTPTNAIPPKQGKWIRIRLSYIQYRIKVCAAYILFLKKMGGGAKGNGSVLASPVYKLG